MFPRPSRFAVVPFLMMGVPAAAQSICGLPESPGTWIGGDEAGSDITTAGEPLEGLVSLADEQNGVTLFVVSEETGVRLDIDPVGAGDPLVELYADNGALLAEDDDGGNGSGSRIDMMLSPATYCLVTREYNRTTMDARVRISPVSAEDIALRQQGGEAGDSCPVDAEARVLEFTNAEDLGDGLTVSASAAEAPRYRFQLTEDLPLTIRADNQDADPVLKLFDADGVLLEENDDFDGRNAQISAAEGLAAGTYCIGVRALNSADLPISISISVFDAEEELRRLYARGEASPPLNGAYPVEDLGPLAGAVTQDAFASDDVAWYSFEIAEPSLLLIDAIGVGPVDPTLVFFDAAGRLVNRDDDGGADTNARLAEPVQAGRYMVGVGRVEDSGFGLVRLSIERYVRAR